MMKILVVYFSRNGQTARMAKEVARRCGADLEAIREPDSSSAWGTRWRAAWQMLVRSEPPILQPLRNPRRYELVIIGSPASSLGVAPAVRTYVRQYRDSFKQVAFFCAEGTDADERVFAELTRMCGKSPEATFRVRRKGLPPAAHKDGLTDFVNDLRAE